MTLNEDPVVDDLRERFSDQVHQLVAVVADSCRDTDMSVREIVALIITPLMCESVMAVIAADMKREEFLPLCAHYYDHLQTALDAYSARKIH